MEFEDLNLSGLDEPQEEPHEFETDLRLVVVANHGFTMEAIDRSEDEEISQLEKALSQKALSQEDHEIINSLISDHHRFYDDLRQAAHRLAVVALVTRLQHWVGKFARRLKIVPQSTLARQLEALNEKLGVGTVSVPVVFFDELVTLRDSIIHNDSQAEWEYRGTHRKVADRYRYPYGPVEVSDEQLKDAIEKAVQQVKLYDERMHARCPPGRTNE